ncbi:hypothetical protein AZOA_04490 [Azoarcus sp. Aa7]|nr:hypothetical protein [Azoarcus sp. Aa7]
MSNELIGGHEYFATLHLRTPLVVLMKDGEHTSSKTPPDNPYGLEHGIWVPTIRSWRELGIDFDDGPESDVASDIGPVNRVKYRNFLITVKAAASQDESSIAERINRIKEVLKLPEHKAFCRRLGGQTAIIDALFPPVVSMICGITKPASAALWKSGLRTIEKINKADDSRLLALSGIGKKTLDVLRAFCAQYSGDLRAERYTPSNDV